MIQTQISSARVSLNKAITLHMFLSSFRKVTIIKLTVIPCEPYCYNFLKTLEYNGYFTEMRNPL